MKEIFMNLKKIGKFIAEMRKAKGLTQEELAEKLGVNNRQFLDGKMEKICLIFLYTNHYVKF